MAADFAGLGVPLGYRRPTEVAVGPIMPRLCSVETMPEGVRKVFVGVQKASERVVLTCAVCS